MFFLEDVAQLVLWLLLGLTWVNLVFLCFVFYRRLSRKRYFAAKDAAREHYRPMISQFAAGHIPVEAAAAVLRNARTVPEQDAVRDALFLEAAPADRERTTELLFALGMVEAWAKQAYGKRQAQDVVRRALRHEAAPLAPANSTARRATRSSLRMLAVPRALAVNRLAHLRPEVAQVFAAEALKDPSPEVRRVAVRALGRTRHPAGVPLLAAEIERSFAAGNDISLRTAKAALVAYNLEDLHLFVPLLRHPSRRMRFVVVDTVRQIAERAARKAPLNRNDFPIEMHQLLLNELARDEFADVRARTASVLRHFRDAAAVEALRKLTTDEDEFVRLHAVRACGDPYLPQLLSAVTDRLGDPRWRVREAAVKSITAFGQAGDQELYRYFIQSPDRYACEQLAEEIQRRGLVLQLMDLLQASTSGRASPGSSAHHGAQLATAVFQKLVMLGKGSLLLHAAQSPELDANTRLKLLDLVAAQPTQLTLSTFAYLAQTDPGPVGEHAAELLRHISEASRAAAAGSDHA
ncbi:MAG TPA: HEAT repeat domain-containing protein [Terriglobales bacterium]|nr:HEAT repeat domain-containing protein [Terriglobales bacterium]